MSGSLRDSAVDHLKETLSLIQEGKTREAIEELEKAEEAVKLLLNDPENEFFRPKTPLEINDVFTLGYRLHTLGHFSHAQNFYKLSLLIYQKLLKTDPGNESYQSYLGTTLNKIDYFENIGRDNKTRIFQCDCCNGVCVDRDLQIAAVQLKYHAYGENSVVKLTTDDAYHQKVMAILEALKDEADIVVFPEFSIPFDYLEEIKEYADENEVIVVAGSHYVTGRQLAEYGKIFSRGFEEEDLRKNISPVIIPSSRLYTTKSCLVNGKSVKYILRKG